MLIVSLIFFLALIFLGLVIMLRSIINKNVNSATKHLEELSAEYARKESEIDKQLDEVKRKSQEALASAQDEAQKQKEQIIKSAEEGKAKILQDVQAKVDQMIQQADRSSKALLAQMQKKIEEGSMLQAVKLLDSVLPEDLRRQIHKRWVGDLIAGNLKQLEHLKVDQAVKEAQVITAFGLSEEEKESLSAKIKEKLGRAMELKEIIDPQMVSGMVVKVGSLVFDGSLKTRIQEAAYNKA